MSDKVRNILEAAKDLTEAECAEVACRLLDRLDDDTEIPDQAEIDASWADEAERRIQAYREGKIDSEPGEQVMAELFAKYKK